MDRPDGRIRRLHKVRPVKETLDRKALARENNAHLSAHVACCEGPHKGLKLVHISAQRKRILWDRGCIGGLFERC